MATPIKDAPGKQTVKIEIWQQYSIVPHLPPLHSSQLTLDWAGQLTQLTQLTTPPAREPGSVSAVISWPRSCLQSLPRPGAWPAPGSGHLLDPGTPRTPDTPRRCSADCRSGHRTWTRHSPAHCSESRHSQWADCRSRVWARVCSTWSACLRPAVPSHHTCLESRAWWLRSCTRLPWHQESCDQPSGWGPGVWTRVSHACCRVTCWGWDQDLTASLSLWLLFSLHYNQDCWLQ